MIFRDALYFFKSVFEFLGKVLLVILTDGQAAAFFRSVIGERADDGVAACVDGPTGCRKVARDLGSCRKKVEGSSVVPYIVRAHGPEVSNIGYDPLYTSGFVAKTLAGAVQGFFRYIQDCDVLISLCQQVIHEVAVASAYVDNASVLGQVKGTYKVERSAWNVLCPTQFLRGLGPVDGIPMGLVRH